MKLIKNNLYYFIIIMFLLFIDFFNRSLINSSFNSNQISPLIFNIIWIAFGIIIVFILPRVLKKVLTTIITSFLLVFSLTNYFFSSYFNTIVSWRDARLSGDGLSFFDCVTKYIDFKLIIFLIISLFLIIIIYKITPKQELNINKYKLVAITFVMIIITTTYIITINRLKNNNTITGRYYNDWVESNNLLSICSTYQYLVKDFYNAFFRSSNHIIAKENVTSYLSTKKSSSSLGEYTNTYENKNLIFVMMESMDDWMVSEEVTPTIWYMMHHGFNFSNHYSPIYTTGSTANTEFIANTGIYPVIDSLAPHYAYLNNNYPYALANLFKNKDYKVNSFHESSSSLYNRNFVHQQFGYDKYYSSKDLNIDSNNSLLDSYMIKNGYNKIIDKNQKFMSFIITYTPHTPYKYNTITCKANLNLVNSEYDDEEKICALSSAIETDNMFKMLLDKLKTDSLLENTIIIAFTDHSNNVVINKDETLKLNKTIFFIYDEAMSENMISIPTSTIDILPTINNLFNLTNEYVYPGKDALNIISNNVVFRDYTYYDGEKINTITDSMYQDLKYSANLLISDYYRH